MESSVWCAILLVVLACNQSRAGERVHKVSEPTSVSLPINDEITLTCEMNINPDSLQWRYYPLGREQASNPDAPLVLSKANYIELPKSSSKNDKKRSSLMIKLSNYSLAGDYQCLAHYGASVLASIPDRITVTTLGKFPAQNVTRIKVTVGNTILWRCEPPVSNPPAYIDYIKDGKIYNQSLHSTSLIIANVSENDKGTYKCKATNTLLSKMEESSTFLQLNVVKYGGDEMPRFLFTHKTEYTAQKGQSVFLECGAVGTPVPKVTWERLDGILDKSRTFFKPGGLEIIDITESDHGVYICKHSNVQGTVELEIILIYTEAPKITKGPINPALHRGEKLESNEGEDLELRCTATGYPQPEITWLLNGKPVHNDKRIEAVGGLITFTYIEKRHAGIVQCFATNSLGTTYSSAELHVIPKQIPMSNMSDDVATTQAGEGTGRRGKTTKKYKGSSEMIPPSKPTVTRVSDNSVMIRWSVPPNDGLPILFFKVQYRELGPSNGDVDRKPDKWKTNNLDIAPNIRSFEVNNLQSNHFYKFRIAAVYTNNDNKLSPKSDKFHLTGSDFFMKNPLAIPKLTHTQTVNSTSIRIYWEFEPNSNATVDGFLISYMSASSAGDYMIATVDGERTITYTITHLVPDTLYDIKMQSFNSKSASDFSPILKQKTAKNLTTEAPIRATPKSVPGVKDEVTNSTSLFIFIAVAVVLTTLILSVIVFLIICRKWKQKKDDDSSTRAGDRNTVEDINHHIQADSNDYVVLSRNNGHAIPPNRITITANPLADADNKSQNMIEMSCLSSQNNNCTAASASTEEAPTEQPEQKGKHKNREHKRRKQNSDLPPSENYV